MDEKNESIIKDVTEELLKNMGFDAEVVLSKNINNDESKDENDQGLVCNISVTDNSNFLIGQHGVNLEALQHVIRLLVRKKTENQPRFIIDVNAYRQQKTQSIIEQAQEASKQALSEKRAIIMKPMSAYERRVVHMELAGDENVNTESVGDGEDRKVVVKSAENIN